MLSQKERDFLLEFYKDKYKDNFKEKEAPKVDEKEAPVVKGKEIILDVEKTSPLKSHWSLCENNKKLEPLKFSNGKTQEDVVNEVVNLIKKGKKVIFIQGVCGTGKSAIALNISKALGRGSIVVPIKSLQRQYEHDYIDNKYMLKENGDKLNITIITGRDNHDSVIKPGISCADPFLPDTITMTEKNRAQILEYYESNPYISQNTKKEIEMKKLKRIAIAPANPYWSPIINSVHELPMRDAKKKRYLGLNGKEFIFYHRKKGCTYYDQYDAYINSDVIIFNAAKYKIEVALDRKPLTDVDIIDECDEFLDSFSNERDLNLTRLSNSLKILSSEYPEAQEIIEQILELIKLEEQQKKALGIDEKKVYPIGETKIEKIISLLSTNPALEAEITLDETNYSNAALEIAHEFVDFLDDTYVSFKRYEDNLTVQMATINLSKQFSDLVNKNKALVLMSGTLHSKKVLKEIFGVKDFEVVEAETKQPGTIEIHRTGKEFDCKYENFKNGENTREGYLKALSACVNKSTKPTLIHVQAFEDLPKEEEKINYELKNLVSREELSAVQKNDKSESRVSEFKQGKTPVLFTTKCSRGIDFPGKMCNSVILTKYPNPNTKSIFWAILKETFPKYYWDFYKDKASREFLQKIYRAVRSKTDHVYVLSPDSRVLDGVRKLQLERGF